MARTFLLLSFVMIAMASRAWGEDDSCPRMAPAEVDAQWQDYASRSGAKPVAFGNGYDCISFQIAGPILVCRTKPDHPAHPSIIAVKMLLSGGSFETRMDGHTAGNCAAFQDMMGEIKQGLVVQTGSNHSPH
jgi:hypothetical protein